jgi:hypothetical protein
MKTDYNFEILSYLYNSEDETINVRPFIDKLAKESSHSSTYFGTLLNQLRTKRLLWFDDVLCLSWIGNSPFAPDHPIKARIEPDGINEYFRLKKQYEPETNNGPRINIGGDVIGSVLDSSLGNAHISPTININDPTPNKRSLLEIVSWIAGIGAFIFVLWEFILKRLLHQP